VVLSFRISFLHTVRYISFAVDPCLHNRKRKKKALHRCHNLPTDSDQIKYSHNSHNATILMCYSVWLRTERSGFDSRQKQRIFFLRPLRPDRLRPTQASYTMTTGVPFPGGKAQPGRDADKSVPPSKKEWQLYLLSAQATSRACSGVTLLLPKS
jgi:hypothetical protein